jgi:hypothetical protein
MGRRRLASENLAAMGRRKIATQALDRKPSRRKMAAASAGSGIASAATHCAARRREGREANRAAPANGRSPPQRKRSEPGAKR